MAFLPARHTSSAHAPVQFKIQGAWLLRAAVVDLLTVAGGHRTECILRTVRGGLHPMCITVSNITLDVTGAIRTGAPL